MLKDVDLDKLSYKKSDGFHKMVSVFFYLE